jgi:tRNA(fMet)-specific endonuclease VapC
VGRGVILDSGIVIRLARGALTVDELGDGDDQLAIAAITVAEFQTGPRVNPDSRRAQNDLAWFAAFCDHVDILDYTVQTAHHHAALLAHTRTSGEPRGAHDLIIAAHASQTSRTILTTDTKARFDELPRVAAITVP